MDTQGLPVELQAAKELGLTGGKQEIVNFGQEKLVSKAKEMIQKYYQSWISADKLLGVMMDHEKDYWTYKDEYIEREWQIMKTAWKNGLLGESYQVVGYCPSCQTALSHSEVSLEYEMLEDPSLYYKAKLRGYENRFIVLWTTMPFTLITDAMVGAKPSAKYSIVDVKGEEWVIASNRVNDVMKEWKISEFKVKSEILGRYLEGEKYYYPLAEEIPKQIELEEKSDLHIVVLDESVDISTGTGLVHMAPANGEIDFEVARKENIPVFNPFDESACFTSDAGKYSGIFARETDQIVIGDLERKGLLVHTSTIIHEYPTCWRSHHRLIWLARREYFYWVEKIGDLAYKAAEEVQYYFEAPRNRFLNIIKEKKPWCVSRERVWGTPLPIWACSKCGEKMGLFSRKNIVENALELPDGPDFELHRPWMDRVVVKCRKCGGKAYREPFVLDTWHNSGASYYAAFTDEEYAQCVPVEFLTEAIDQTRGWAYSLLTLSVIQNNSPKSPYKAFLFQGHILGPDEMKMSKSLGNVIDANKTLVENSVDTLRFYFAWKNSPISTMVFRPDEIQGRPFQVLNTLYHLHVYLQQNSLLDKFDDGKHTLDWALQNGLTNFLDKWILSRMQRMIGNVVKAYSKGEYNEVARSLEDFIVEELSQKYVPAVRKELWTDEPITLDRRLTVYALLGYCLKTLDILLHPISPFVTEKLYIECFSYRKETVLMEDMPKIRAELINDRIDKKFDIVNMIISAASSLRMKSKLKRRWPVEEIIFISEKAKDLTEEEVTILEDLLNTKKLEKTSDMSAAPLKFNLRPNLQVLGKKLKGKLPRLLLFLEKEDKDKLARKLMTEKETLLSYDETEIQIQESDFEFLMEPEEGYAYLDVEGDKLFMKISRNANLIKEGILRDVARRIQAYRKELGLNPAQIVKVVEISSDDNEITETIREKGEELKFLVRADRINIMEELSEKWKSEEIDDKMLKINIMP